MDAAACLNAAGADRAALSICSVRLFVALLHCLVTWGEGLCTNTVSLSLVPLAESMANCNAKISVDMLFRYLHAAG